MDIIGHQIHGNWCEPTGQLVINLGKIYGDKGDLQTRTFLKGLGRMFYVVDPAETTFGNAKDVPKFFLEVIQLKLAQYH